VLRGLIASTGPAYVHIPTLGEPDETDSFWDDLGRYLVAVRVVGFLDSSRILNNVTVPRFCGCLASTTAALYSRAFSFRFLALVPPYLIKRLLDHCYVFDNHWIRQA
jgi:hypothetical protein